MKHFKIHQLLFFFFLLTLPFQTRIIYDPGSAYIGGVFNYHLAYILYLSDLVFLVALIDWLVFHKPQIISRGTNLLGIMGFFGLILATLFHVKHIDLGTYEALKWLEMLILLVYGWINFRDRRFLEVSLGIIFISGFIQAFLGIFQFHVQHGLNLSILGEYVATLGTPGLATIAAGGQKLIRAYGTMPHPNVLGGFLVLTLISGLYYVSRATKDETSLRETMFHRRMFHAVTAKGLVSAVGVTLILLGIFFTFSRIAWISAILVVFGYLLFHVKHKEWSKVIVTVIVIFVSCATIFIGYRDLAISRLSTETLVKADGSWNNKSLSLRETYNRQGIELVKKYPLLGVGVGHYVPAIRDMFHVEPWQYQPVHNIYILLAAELGVLGLGLFLVMVSGVIKLAWNKNNQPAFVKTSAGKLLTFSLFLAVGSFLFIGLFDHYPLTIQQTRLTFFLLLGMLAATASLEETKIEDKSNT